MNHLIEYYNQYDEESRLITNKARRVEFITTTTYLDKVITSNSRILDVAAGTGIYSFHYAELGYDVFAGDIVPKHIDIIQKKLDDRLDKKSLKIKSEVMNAVDLTRFENDSFDVVLCMGPLYHLLTEAERDKCIDESLRVLRTDGILAIAYINKFFILPMLMKSNAAYLNDVMQDKILLDGVIRDGEEGCFWTDAFFTSPQEVDLMFKNYNTDCILHIGTDGISTLLPESVDNLNEEEFNMWIKYHIRTCREESLLGYSNHGLYVCKKRK